MSRVIPKLTIFALCTASLGWFGCGAQPASAKEPKEPSKACEAVGLSVSLAAGDRLNADGAGAARPVQVRVYQLRSDARLKNAKFDEVWQDPAMFQTDLVKMEEHTLYPNDTKTIEIEPNADVHAVAAVGLFREPQGKTWFASYDIDPPSKTGPCSKDRTRISVWLDRMQIEDGRGRTSSGETNVTPRDSAKPGANGN